MPGISLLFWMVEVIFNPGKVDRTGGPGFGINVFPSSPRSFSLSSTSHFPSHHPLRLGPRDLPDLPQIEALIVSRFKGTTCRFFSDHNACPQRAIKCAVGRKKGSVQGAWGILWSQACHLFGPKKSERCPPTCSVSHFSIAVQHAVEDLEKHLAAHNQENSTDIKVKERFKQTRVYFRWLEGVVWGQCCFPPRPSHRIGLLFPSARVKDNAK